MSSAIHWIAAKIGKPGVGDAFAGVFSDAVSDPSLREILSARLQDPYRLALQEALGEPENRVLFFIDVMVGTLLHRLGMTGEPMADTDVAALVRDGSARTSLKVPARPNTGWPVTSEDTRVLPRGRSEGRRPSATSAALVWIVEDSAVTADRPRVGGCASALDARWFRPRHTGSQRICHRGDRCR